MFSLFNNIFVILEKEIPRNKVLIITTVIVCQLDSLIISRQFSEMCKMLINITFLAKIYFELYLLPQIRKFNCIIKGNEYTIKNRCIKLSSLLEYLLKHMPSLQFNKLFS